MKAQILGDIQLGWRVGQESIRGEDDRRLWVGWAKRKLSLPDVEGGDDGRRSLSVCE